jgi:hypothetical protein
MPSKAVKTKFHGQVSWCELGLTLTAPTSMMKICKPACQLFSKKNQSCCSALTLYQVKGLSASAEKLTSQNRLGFGAEIALDYLPYLLRSVVNFELEVPYEVEDEQRIR